MQQKALILLATLILLANFATASVTNVPFTKALQAAEKIAAMKTNWQVMVGSGNSMAPLYSSNSVLIVENANYEELQAGMIVVYRDTSGDLVAHSLMTEDTNGWIAKGINNPKSDPEQVTESNLVGLIFGVFTADAAPENTIADNYEVVLGKTF